MLDIVKIKGAKDAGDIQPLGYSVDLVVLLAAIVDDRCAAASGAQLIDHLAACDRAHLPAGHDDGGPAVPALLEGGCQRAQGQRRDALLCVEVLPERL